jgi:hypothetical protein
MPEPVMIHWGPYYYAQRPDGDLNAGELYPTDPSMVGAAPVVHTFYIFGVPDEGPKVMVSYLGEGPYDPSGPIAQEARFQLFGARVQADNEVRLAAEEDSAGGVTIVKEPPP